MLSSREENSTGGVAWREEARRPVTPSTAPQSQCALGARLRAGCLLTPVPAPSAQDKPQKWQRVARR